MGAWISTILSALLSRWPRTGNALSARSSSCHKTDNALPGMSASCLRTDSDLPPFVPSTTWTGHRIYQSSCQCFTDPLVMANVAKMDPLIAAGFHNLICSPLCRLPEELLLDIIQQLDLVSIRSLRRVSRLFIRLFSSPKFYNTYDSTCKRFSFEHWYDPGDNLYTTWFPKLQVLLNRDIGDCCEDCRKKRTGPNWARKNASLTKEYLHCSGCRIDHPVCLFSKIQRSTRAKSRMCIGREGFVRICEHRAVTWKELIRTSLQLADLDTGFACVFLDKCKHESHSPKHHRNEIWLLHHQTIYPTIEIWGCLNERVLVRFSWQGHLKLPDIGFGEDGYNKTWTPNLIYQQLVQFRQGTAQYIIPEFSPGRLLEMNCFDPNRCACLHYTGIEQLPKGWQLTPQESESGACRKYPNSRLGPLRSFRNNKQESLQGEEKRIESHVAEVHTTGTINYGSSTAMVRIEPCPTESRCLQIHYTRLITLIPKDREVREANDITWVWFQALDPDSYNLTDDEETFGILWCRQPRCKNYYRYLRKAPFALEDTNRSCKRSCPK